MGGGSTQEPEDKPSSVGEEEKRKMKKEGNEEEEDGSNSISSLDAEGTLSSAAVSEREEEQPSRQLACLGIPDFLMSDAPEGNSGKQIILMMLLFLEKYYKPGDGLIMTRVCVCRVGCE